MAVAQVPSIGRIVHYRLSAQDVEAVTRRRTTGASIAERMSRCVLTGDPPVYAWPEGAQAHVGNPVSEGDVVPLTITAVWPNEFGEGEYGVNGQALLDGNDSLWVTSAKQGEEPGQWSWPPKV